jgi:hypothetical protein
LKAAVADNTYTYTPPAVEDEEEDPTPGPTPITVIPDNQRTIWVGYKDALDEIESYQIIGKGQSIYTQNYAIDESYITALATTEAVKRTDIFSKTWHSDVWAGKNTIRTGALVVLPDTATAAGTEFPLHIRIKIDNRRFRPLANAKYLPKFIGNFELRVKFSGAGLVCAPVPISDVFQTPYWPSLIQAYPAITTTFVPIGQSFYTLGAIPLSATTATAAVAVQSLSLTNYTVTQCYSILHCFGLDSSIYQTLMQRYSQTSLAFPIQTLSFQPMN